MALGREQAAQAGDAYVAKLASDANAREVLSSAAEPGDVAKHISSIAGFHVGEDDLVAIADHLNTNRGAECEDLAAQYPALGAIVAEGD
jgi:hypothetical protein